MSRTRSIWRKCILASLVAACAVPNVAAPNVSAQSAGIVGQPLVDATKQDLFTYFHFAERSRKKTEMGDTVVEYAASCMGNPVMMHVIVEPLGNRVDMMALMLDRKFVDDPKVGVFARDVVKSFVKQGVPEADAPAVGTLVNEIAYGGGNWKPKTDIYIPTKSSAGYEAFLGNGPDFKKAYSNCEVWIQNKNEKGNSRLALAIIRTRASSSVIEQATPSSQARDNNQQGADTQSPPVNNNAPRDQTVPADEDF